MRPLLCLMIVAGLASAQSWTTWRGSDGLGVSRDGNPPTEWSEEKNVRWKTELPGNGSSSPVVWKDRIYVTCAVETERVGEPTGKPTGRSRRGRGRGGFGRSALPTHYFEFLVVAVDRKTGKIAWRVKVADEIPHEGKGHKDTSYAAPSPITDGERVYAHFGSRGLYCVDLSGKVLWSKKLGQTSTIFKFGEGSTPVLHGETLVVNWDHEGESFVVAFDKTTGKELWRTERRQGTTWASPAVAQVKGKVQVVIPGPKRSIAYDLSTGKELWSCGGMTRSCVPTPVVVNGICYIMSGFMGAVLQAIDIGSAKGDIEDTPSLRWVHKRGTSYVPSPLVYDGFLYFLRVNSGTLSCIDATSGEVHYQGKRTGLRTVYASPVGAGGRVYLTGQEGAFKVLKLGKTFTELASNSLDDIFDASPAVVGDALYLRGRNNLYCIAEEE
ncbi:MAG: PQQ-binding-like beta-propeller repeat protein [Planctomycetota bacterium]|nr:PQQ-binding-like beta-propeller repeat protein [Planctomycetota bacterium]